MTTVATFLAGRGKFLAGCCLFTVLNSDLLSKHERPSQQMHASSCRYLASSCDRKF